MRKLGKRKMFIMIGVLLICIGGIMIWFHIPYSPVKEDFKRDIAVLKNNIPISENKKFTREDFSDLPLTIQRYIENCGYIGTSQMSYMKMEYHDVDFMQSKNGPSLKIDYTQYNFVATPCRMALIDSSMFGVPFEGYDYYQNGIGGMKGILAKVITLFDQKGLDMDKACLVTFLAESMFAPSILLQDYITFEEINDYEIKATINYAGQTVSGIFTFNEQYEMIAFVTNDRAVTNGDGIMEYISWSAVCGEYQMSESGIKYPTKFQAIWNYPDGDFVYFDGQISSVTYNT